MEYLKVADSSRESVVLIYQFCSSLGASPIVDFGITAERLTISIESTSMPRVNYIVDKFPFFITHENGRFYFTDFAPEPENESSSLSKQVGGSHYKDMVIQPVEFIHRNGIDYLSGNVIKYASRHKLKNGKEDILKAIHYCKLILELQYGEKTI